MTAASATSMETREQAGPPARGIDTKHSTHKAVGNNGRLGWGALALCAAVSMACFDGSPSEGRGTILVASTTSLYDSGLLDSLVPAFGRAYPGREVRVVSVGTGEALELGRRGDVDLLLVHAPEAEREFLRAGYGHHRAEFMRNDFVLAGPVGDPAAVAEAGSAEKAFRAIDGARALFISRGDRSGTHMRELALWRAAGIEPAGRWYREVGQGMGASLVIASEKQGYVLTDRATFASMGDRLDLRVLYEGDPALRNVYAAIEVEGARNATGACLFSRWLRNEATLREIARFGTDVAGTSLFTPLPAAAVTESSGGAEKVCRARQAAGASR